MEFPFELISEINFTTRHVPISYDLRPLHKVTQILLVLRLASYQNTGSLVKLQLFNWAFKSTEGAAVLSTLKGTPQLTPLRFDPSVNRALSFAIAQGLVEFKVTSGKFSILESGLRLCNAVMQDAELLSKEKEIIRGVGRVSDNLVHDAFRKRSLI